MLSMIALLKLNFSQCALQWNFENNFAVLKLMDHFQTQYMLEHALYDSFIETKFQSMCLQWNFENNFAVLKLIDHFQTQYML